MRFEAKLTGDAATLAREHTALLERLPATVHAFIIVELQRWPLLFEPERRYQRALLTHLASFAAADLSQATQAIVRVEEEAGCGRLRDRDPRVYQDEAQKLLRTRQRLGAWRQEIDAFFRRIDPALEARLYPADRPGRVVVQLYGTGIAVQPAKLWSRFKDVGVRIPLALDDVRGADAFLRTLLSGSRQGDAPLIFDQAADRSGGDPLEPWIIEADQALHAMCGASKPGAAPREAVTGLSYDRLRPYRDELTRALYKKIVSGVESPQAFAAFARGLTLAPPADALLQQDDRVLAFVRDVFLTGNGTLFVNNTFAEWATVQALRRAQPRLIVTRFGVRDKLKPFSSLLLFSQPRPSDQIPMIEDPVGSFVDVEQLSYYVWVNAEKSAAYRNRTLYLFLAEGVDEMLAIRSDAPASQPRLETRATLADVSATMAQWLRVPQESPSGRPIAALADQTR
jgi:hypothetical protein